MRKNKGITLATLTITVIILFMLIGISVEVIKDNDLINKAKETTNNAKQQAINQTIQEENMYNTWGDLPGESIKGPTL